MWLCNGVRYESENGNTVWQSSFVAQNFLNAPYEMVAFSITLFLAGLGVYLGSAWRRKLEISVIEGASVGNPVAVVIFIVGTGFSCSLFGFLVGQKDVENQIVERNFTDRESEIQEISRTLE